jgi:type I restriction enzyme S subunit
VNLNQTKLPNGWLWAKIEQLGEIVTGSTPSKKNPAFFGESIPFYKPTDLDVGYEVIDAREYLSELGANQSRLLPALSVLVTCIGATIGKTGLARKSCATNQQINAVILSEPYVSPHWFFWIISSPQGQQMIIENASATTLPIINKGRFSELTLPVPPLNEQRRIVTKIEALKARSQRVKEELEAIAPLLDQFRQSVLAAAFRGDLTADWREKNPDIEPASELLKQIQEERKTQYEQACIRAKAEGIRKPNPIQDISISLEKEEFQDIPNSWVWASLESISNFCRPITYGVIKLGDEVENGVPCLRTSDVKPLSIKLENVKKISRAIANNYSRTYLQGGELLVNVRGTLGGVAVVPEHLAGYNISREVAMVPILSNIPVTWTAYWVASVTAQTWLTNVSKGVAYTGINLEDLRQLPVPIPPVAEIKVAVETIEKLYFISSQIEQQYNEAKAHLDKLDQSILAKAFRGELVPQDPNDEPASVLLERIRAERENLDTKKKAKGKTEKKSRKAKPEATEPEQLSLPGFE